MRDKKKNAKARFIYNKKKNLAALGTIIGLIATLFYPTDQQTRYAGASLMPAEINEAEALGAFPIVVPTVKFGFVIDTFLVAEGKVVRNQTLGTLLSKEGMAAPAIEQLVKNTSGVFDINRNFGVGKDYMLLKARDGSGPAYLVFEPNVFEYIVFELSGDMSVRKVEREVTVETRHVDGKIKSSLWEALTRQGVNMEAAAKMEDALQWSVDFSHAQKGDEFRLVYDEKYINEKPVGCGQVHAASYKREGKDYYAFWFQDGEYKGFYDYEGRPAKSGFLMSPVKYTRISSSFSHARLHPILKSVRPHLGTDYAAPHGTPIYAVGDGTVEEADFTKGNGRYVKIRHDKVYQTQYLHMSRFAKGIRKGVHVSQGEVIGYVGSTGLATGPHVCFRFWKNGKQVNHLKEKLPTAKKLPDDVLPAFYKVRDEYMKLLEGKQRDTAESGTSEQVSNETAP